MAENPNPTPKREKLNGLFVRGVVISSTARLFNRKDGSGKVLCVRHELALQPGVAIAEEFPDVKGANVKIEGEVVLEFPKLAEFEQVMLRILRWEERDKRLVIKEWEKLA